MDAQRIQKRNYSRKRDKGSHFGIGDKVLKKDFRRKKRAGGALDPKWLGPYEVMKDNGKGLFLVKRCDDGKVDRAHGDHLKVFVVPKQIEYSHKPTVEHQKSHMSMQENHIVENDSNSNESAYEDCSVMGLRTKRFIRPWSTVLTTIETKSFPVGHNISGSNVLTSRTKRFKIGQKVSETFYPWDKKFLKLFVLGLKLLVPRIKFTYRTKIRMSVHNTSPKHCIWGHFQYAFALQWTRQLPQLTIPLLKRFWGLAVMSLKYQRQLVCQGPSWVAKCLQGVNGHAQM